MSVNDELAAAQRALDEMLRYVKRLEQQLGSSGLEMRRVRIDADRLRESLALLRETDPALAKARRQDFVPISDAPYDNTLWTDSDDEGLGAHHRHTP
ncbi:regulator of replication initiation timing [Streptomyces sp. SAI-208]|uniref:hypothetical protein n=1 Tax=unclassified Streptomyces TaxID=2593676 RepID=UPI0024767896|nr:MULTISPECIES: hypothetical protein [unclassified Streptomyces]MDH6516737.1 regulator of replication initiation timing [Streptomyces sp. SAI-090]MDH6548949.1 regulator of replication initiation timing [Streptomyces sp. SAI-041]MDH6568019.1 regulator of replication initiation timing [Streptomyces sp. SAI-117]MDH6587033.1 regulator of replication initiation timing [Streptomyces sp. SAI-133]MDH6607558.1 regulator of replication initiation timing [Streptomyces sp. SAI-208]